MSDSYTKNTIYNEILRELPSNIFFNIQEYIMDYIFKFLYNFDDKQLSIYFFQHNSKRYGV